MLEAFLGKEAPLVRVCGLNPDAEVREEAALVLRAFALPPTPPMPPPLSPGPICFTVRFSSATERDVAMQQMSADVYTYVLPDDSSGLH